MSAISGRRLAGGLLFWPLALVSVGCGPSTPAPDPAVETTAPEAAGPAEIELSDPVVTFVEPNRVRFEVHYRFTRGRPNKYYLCEISFPGTPNHGAKPMERWELELEGSINDRITLTMPPVEKFEIHVSEAESPQYGYKKISNVLSGTVSK